MSLKDRTCYACGKISHSVDKDGRLAFPDTCPYCGTEKPFRNRSRFVAFALAAAVLLVFGWLSQGR